MLDNVSLEELLGELEGAAKQAKGSCALVPIQDLGTVISILKELLDEDNIEISPVDSHIHLHLCPNHAARQVGSVVEVYPERTQD